MENPIRITLARKKTELKQIIELQKKNHLAAVDEATAKDQGFVTAVHDYKVLEAMNSAAATVIAKDGNRVVGYALTMKREFANDVPALTELFHRQDEAIHRGERLGDAGYLVMGQICVAEEARGHRVADRMYKYMRSCYSLHYPYLVTAIDARNTRSIHVHERIGFKELDRFVGEQSGKDWLLVIWNWRD
ncbi:GNAT family N-acetyltransferase [Neolewinella persica]|uniref:GNAT family N-acetyltransferase n=1 Tax=Neolewinella persica TaxID=70998 RepID=UPI000365BF9D|nr:GNAT family N-acetyltransferase [Neolewinella persica]